MSPRSQRQLITVCRRGTAIKASHFKRPELFPKWDAKLKQMERKLTVEDNIILEIRNVVKSFSGVTVLHGINLNVKKGEVHVVVGENGAGKSTLMKIISGVYHRDSGEIIYEGKPVEYKTVHESQNAGISIIHQELNLLPHRTAGQNIFIGREQLKVKFLNVIDQNKMYEESTKLLQFLGVDLDPRTNVSMLGIAQQQMVEVAKALTFESKVLIMDEPTATLTSREITRLFEVIHKLKEQGVSIIYISHRLEEIKQIADRLTVLRDGNTVATLDAKKASVEEIIKLMVGREITNQYARDYKEPGEEILSTVDLNSYRFKNANISVHRGEIVGISGLVGAGRTELALTIFGQEHLASGKVILFGKEFKKMNTRRAVKLKVGLVPEDRKNQGVAIDMPLKYNVIHASLKRLFKNGIMSKQKENETASKYIKELNIRTTSINKPVHLLSGGNQQKVVVAKWLCAECELIIFDEPTRGIDVGARAEIYSIMNEFVNQGKAILMISSDLPELLGVCDRIFVMKDGRITGELPRLEATQEKILALSI